MLTAAHKRTATVLALIPALLGLGCMLGALGTGAYFSDSLGVPVSILLLVVAFGGGGACLWWMVKYGDFIPSRYYYRVTRSEFAKRPEAWVEADNPEAFYVQVIPRPNWGRVMLENAADVGFLWVDRRQRQIVFEGDRERWRIPAAALLGCEVEQYGVGEAELGGQTFYLAVLRARVGGGVWEAPVAPRHIHWRKRGEKEREQEVRALREELRSVAAP